jgi:hypothetical protein
MHPFVADPVADPESSPTFPAQYWRRLFPHTFESALTAGRSRRIAR